MQKVVFGLLLSLCLVGCSSDPSKSGGPRPSSISSVNSSQNADSRPDLCSDEEWRLPSDAPNPRNNTTLVPEGEWRILRACRRTSSSATQQIQDLIFTPGHQLGWMIYGNTPSGSHRAQYRADLKIILADPNHPVCSITIPYQLEHCCLQMRQLRLERIDAIPFVMDPPRCFEHSVYGTWNLDSFVNAIQIGLNLVVGAGTDTNHFEDSFQWDFLNPSQHRIRWKGPYWQNPDQDFHSQFIMERIR